MFPFNSLEHLSECNLCAEIPGSLQNFHGENLLTGFPELAGVLMASQLCLGLCALTCQQVQLLEQPWAAACCVIG